MSVQHLLSFLLSFLFFLRVMSYLANTFRAKAASQVTLRELPRGGKGRSFIVSDFQWPLNGSITASEDCREPLVVWEGEAVYQIWVFKSMEATMGRMKLTNALFSASVALHTCLSSACNYSGLLLSKLYCLPSL